MKQIEKIITILTLLLAHCESLPITSIALENNSDQLIWQTQFYAQEGKKESPYIGGESRKITAKSIFITPNFNQNASNCPPGFKIDDNGKCIKVVSINQDDLLQTRLQIFFSQHQTTDDSTSTDYDYNDTVEEDKEVTQYELPLIPIIHNDNNEKPPYNFTNESFRDRNNTQDSEVASSTTAAIVTAIMKEADTQGNLSTVKTIEDENTTRVNESDINLDQHDTTTVVDTDTTPVFDENAENNCTTTTSDEFVINESEKAQAEKTISSDSVGNYFDAMLANDSLLFDNLYQYEGTDFENTTDSVLDSTTMGEFTELLTDYDHFTELPSGDKALEEILATEKVIQPLFGHEKTSSSEQNLQELVNNNQAFLANHADLPLDANTFTQFVTVEKTSSFVNGPFLIFGEPFSKSASVEKSSEELSSVEKKIPESSSKASEDFKSSSVNSFEYSTDKMIQTSTTIPDLIRPYYSSSVTDFEHSTVEIFKNQESSKVQNETESQNETFKEDFNKLITSVLPSFTPNPFPYEKNYDQRNRELENAEKSNKFIYHLPTTDASSLVRFPIISHSQRVRFPDEARKSPATFSWPHDNSGLMRFWQDQPLINDFKISRGNSRSSNGNFHRQN